MFAKMREARAARKRFEAHHEAAMLVARDAYDECQGESQLTTGQWELGTYMSAAGPSRIAWEAYFDQMRAFDEDPWKGYSRFDKESEKWPSA